MEFVTWEKRLESEHPALSRAGCASVTYKDRYALILGGRKSDAFFLDCWSFDTVTGALNPLSKGPAQGKPRAYHSATLVGDVIWVVGGSDDAFIPEPNNLVWCFHIKSREWRQPTLSGNTELLRRTAHGACMHPSSPGTILLFGGYGSTTARPKADAPEWLCDLVAIDTTTNTVKTVSTAGKAPSPRAYHTFTAVGSLCISLFGRVARATLVPSRQSVAIFDAKAGKWLPSNPVKGTAPAVRSSHKASAINDGLVLFGGAPSAATDKKGRLSDMYILKLHKENMNGGLEWQACQPNDAAAEWPTGRAAHAQEVISRKLYVLGGYGSHKNYCSDAWEGTVCQEILIPPPPLPVQPAATKKSLKKGAAGAGVVVVEEEGHQERGEADVIMQHSAAENIIHEIDDETGSVTDVAAIAATTAAAVTAVKSGGEEVLVSKWKSSRRAAATAAGADIFPEKTKRQRTNGGGVRNLPTTPTAAAGGGVHPAHPSGSPFRSPAGVVTVEHVNVIEQQLREAQQALVAQRVKEAQLLKEKNDAQSEIHGLRNELRAADENWRTAVRERDVWKIKFEKEEQRRFNTDAKASQAKSLAATAEEKMRDAQQQLQQTRQAADQQAKAYTVTTTENNRLMAQAAVLQRALDEAQAAVEKERQQRTSLQEQNAVLHGKAGEAAIEKARLEGELQSTRSALTVVREQAEIERARLSREISAAKSATLAAERAIDAGRQREVELQASEESLKQAVSRAESKLQRSESEKRSIEEARDQAMREAAEMRNERQKLLQDVDSYKRQLDNETTYIANAVQRMRELRFMSNSGGGGGGGGPSR